VLRLEISRHSFEARREISQISSDVWQMRLIRQLSEFFSGLTVWLGCRLIRATHCAPGD
jgi:hypothetical protein